MLGRNIRTTAGLTLATPLMFNKFLMIEKHLYELSNVSKILSNVEKIIWRTCLFGFVIV